MGTLKTVSDREIPCPPPIRMEGSDRKVANDLNKIVQWLIDESRKEVEVEPNPRRRDFALFLMKDWTPKNVHQAQQETMNDILFGTSNVDLTPCLTGK